MLSTQLTQVTSLLKELELNAETEVTTLVSKNTDLSQQLDEMNLKLAALNVALENQKTTELSLLDQLQEKQREFDQVSVREKITLEQFSRANVEIAELTAKIRDRERENESLQQQASVQGDKFISLQDEYGDLEEKYRSLVRAARSPAGKQVVLVYFVRTDSGYEYRLQETDGEESEVVTKGELDYEAG